MPTATAKPPSDSVTKKGSQLVLASSGAVGAGGAVVDEMPEGGTNVVVVLPGLVVLVDLGRVVDVDAVLVVDAAAVVVVVARVVVVVDGRRALVVVVDSSAVVVVVDDGTICASAANGDNDSETAVPRTAMVTPTAGRIRLRTCPSSPVPKVRVDSGRRIRVESVHLTGPLPAIRRLVTAAADLGIDHEVLGGVLRVPTDAAPALFDRADRVLAPLEAALVRVVRTDLVPAEPAALLAATSSAPTLAHVIARRRHRGLLDSIFSRSGVAVGFQPVVDLETDVPIGYEALLRVRAGGSDVAPADVLAAAEEAGRLVEVDGVARAAAVEEAAAHLGDRLLFLNVLPASLPVPVEHLATFTRAVIEQGLRPSQVVLEAPVGPAGALRRQLSAVFEAAREDGFLIGLDNVRSDRDLGSILIRPDTVKLDRSLVRGLPSTAAAKTFGQIRRETTHMSSMLIAQGIESADHVRAVRDLGVTTAQGWHLGRPGPIPFASEVAVDAS